MEWLSLPQYQANGEISKLAKETIRFERRDAQELMHTASLMTTRSDNFAKLITGHKPLEEYTAKIRPIEDLVLQPE